MLKVCYIDPHSAELFTELSRDGFCKVSPSSRLILILALEWLQYLRRSSFEKIVRAYNIRVAMEKQIKIVFFFLLLFIFSFIRIALSLRVRAP